LHALIGPNGAGKTTAFNLLSGLFPPDAGVIELEGRSVAGLKAEDITAAGVGRSFQITNLFGGLSAQENLRLAVQARSTRRFALWTSAAAMSDVNDETAELIAFVGLAGIERAEAALPLPPGRASSCSTSRSPGLPPPSARGLPRCSRPFQRKLPCCWSSTTSIACSKSRIM
jgi:ABC-type branched-subunit amino acid transport system ATPase component